MISFSKKELEFIKRFYLAEKEALKGGFKSNKAELYRLVFQKKEMGGQSANASANKILKKFEKLEKNEKDLMLQNLEIQFEKEKLEQEREKQNLEFAFLQGEKKAQKKFFLDFEDGKKMAEKNLERLASAIDFSTTNGVLNFIEHIGTIFLSEFHEQVKLKVQTDEGEILQNGTVIVGLAKNLVDTAKLGLDFNAGNLRVELLQKYRDLKKKNVN